MTPAQRSWLARTALGVACVLCLGLASVWLNIERVDMAYTLRRMEKELDDKTHLNAKLEVERENLLSPAQLKKLAEKYGLGPAGPGQMRRAKGEEAAPVSTTRQ